MLQCESSDELDFGDSEECVRESIIQLNIDESDELFLLAIRRNDVAVTEKMVNQGFPVNKVHKSGWNSLMYACDYGSVDVVALLLKYGADSKTQIDTFSALMAVCASQCNTEDHLLLCAKQLLVSGALVNAFDRHQMTPLMYACKHNRVLLAQLLLAHNADADIKDIRGWTAFIYAASNGNKTLMKYLIPTSCDQHRDFLGNSASFPLQQSRKEEYEIEGQQYVDLELFLLGIQCPDCLPLLKKNHVTLEILIAMREQDLQQIGILEVALQKKILAAVASIHRKEWDMPQSTTHVLSSSEAVMAMSHLKKHIQYLQATCHLLINSMNHNQSTYWRMDSASAQELICEARNLDSTVSGLQKKVSQLKDEVQRVEASQCSRSRHTRHTVAIMCVTCFVCCGFYLWWKS